LVIICYAYLGNLWSTYCWAALSAGIFPSFSCEATQLSVTEKRICGDNVLAIYDRELAGLYTSTMQKASSSERKQLVQSQREWLRKRNRCGDSWDCISQAYLTRMYDLQNPPSPYTGHTPPTSAIPPLLAGTWGVDIGPNPSDLKINQTVIGGQRYKVLGIRPERGRRDPEYVVTLQWGDAFIEATLFQHEVLSGHLHTMFWKECRSQSDLKKDNCSTFWLDK
jgi:uncharacterized protein